MSKRSNRKVLSQQTYTYDFSKLMGNLGLAQSIFNLFEKGTLIKSDYRAILGLDNLNSRDKAVIKKLDSLNFTVFHVVYGKPVTHPEYPDFVNYLCVPKDVIKALGIEDWTELEQKKAVKDEIKNTYALAKQGIIFAYVVNKAWGIEEFGSITVAENRGILVRAY